MEDIKNILIQTPVFNAVIDNLSNNSSKINFSKTIGMMDYLFLTTPKVCCRDSLWIEILGEHAMDLSSEILEKLDSYEWDIVSGSHVDRFDPDFPLTEDFLRTYAKKLSWTILCTTYRLPETIFREFKDYVDWGEISRLDYLTDEFLEDFSERLDWNVLSGEANLSQDTIRRFESFVNWTHISEYNENLTEDFITDFLHKIDFLALLRSEYAPGDNFIAYLLTRAYQ